MKTYALVGLLGGLALGILVGAAQWQRGIVSALASVVALGAFGFIAGNLLRRDPG